MNIPILLMLSILLSGNAYSCAVEQPRSIHDWIHLETKKAMVLAEKEVSLVEYAFQQSTYVAFVTLVSSSDEGYSMQVDDTNIFLEKLPIHSGLLENIEYGPMGGYIACGGWPQTIEKPIIGSQYLVYIEGRRIIRARNLDKRTDSSQPFPLNGPGKFIPVDLEVKYIREISAHNKQFNMDGAKNAPPVN